MKITIDTEEHKIIIHNECNLVELIQSLHKLFGDKLGDFKIEVPAKDNTKIELMPVYRNFYTPNPIVYQDEFIYRGTTASPYTINCNYSDNILTIDNQSISLLNNLTSCDITYNNER